MDKFGNHQNHQLLAELYDFVPDYIRRPDVDFYRQLCTAVSGTIIELGCGTGRVLLPVAEAGCRVTGLDFSEAMLSRCRTKLQARPTEVQNRVQLVQASMVEFDLSDRFNLAIIPFRAFLHLTDVADQLSCLQCINRHLVPGGRIVIDVFHPDPAKLSEKDTTDEVEDFPEYDLPDGRRLRRTSRIAAYHRAEQSNDVELIYYLTGRDGVCTRVVQSFPFRYIFRYEMEHLLQLTGFKLIELFGNYDRSPFSDNSPEMIFVGEKTLL